MSANDYIRILSGMRVFISCLFLGSSLMFMRLFIKIYCSFGNIIYNHLCDYLVTGIYLISKDLVFLTIFIGVIFVRQLSLGNLSFKSKTRIFAFVILIRILVPFTNFILIALLSLIGSQIIWYRFFRLYLQMTSILIYRINTKII